MKFLSKPKTKKTPVRQPNGEPRKHLRGDPKGLLGWWRNWRAKIPLLAIVFIGAFLRFYKLDWGSGYFFHPDEYHIAAAVNRLSFPHQMNPELFSYGSFTVYLIYFTQSLLSLITYHLSPNSHFASAILIGRFYSALFSTLTILLVYLISRKVLTTHPHNPTHNPQPTTHYSLLAAALCALLPGLIQQAHFATPESILTFWLMFTLLMLLKYLRKKENKYLYLAAASQGFALGTKIVAITFLPIVLLPPLFLHFNLLNNPLQSIKQRAFVLLQLIKQEFLAILIIFLTFFISFPYAFLDRQGFINSFNYESGVARGTIPVFYTRQFINTNPIVFQFTKIFPYALGPGVLILGTLGCLGHLYYILLLAFLFYFLPNAFLFAKWTRFMAPVFPFFAIFTAYFISLIKNKRSLMLRNKNLLSIIYYLLSIITLLWCTMFFSIYLRPDVRITATDWLNQNLPNNSFILTEAGNMLEVPLEGNLKKVSFDFYHLEENSQLQDELPELLAQTDYFIIQSRRIFANHQRLPEKFPQTANFYNLLFTDRLGFERIKEFDSFPTLRVRNLKLEINDEMAEETWSVFDHPVIRVYKKTRSLTAQDYEELLKI